MGEERKAPGKGEVHREAGLTVRRIFVGDRGSREVVRSLLRAHRAG